MKAILVIAALVIGSLTMGGVFYYVLNQSANYQSEVATHMKDAFLASVEPIEVKAANGELWVFPKDPALWTFQILGTVLKVTPSTPSIMKEGGIQTYASIEAAPTWPEVKTALHALVFENLRLNPKPSANNELEIVAP